MKLALAIVFALSSAPAWSQAADDHASHHPESTAAPSASQAAATEQPSSVNTSSEMSEGVIRKVDKDQQKITIKHGELKNLDMPPMTMVFRVSDPAFVDQVNPGDEVFFVAEKLEGKFTVTRIEKKN